jgi:alkanesulfonate monooxygenase SsuD/methylene tetrahydromethanopterin reductase-like flavin-dependent oxidoreductase (luciferase family)
MKNQTGYNLGVMFRREHPPETLPRFARRVEELGFDELWVVEDCFYTSGIASAATALACTEALTVGLGIMPAVVRNSVFTAMEIATLARLYPGRFLPGLGHGVASWMRQIGAFPTSQLTALEEVTVAVRKLLAGETLTLQGGHVHVEQAQLVHPPTQVPPISLGVIGPKSLALSGRVADGTILSEYAAPAYVSWACEQIANGKETAGHERSHRLTVFAFACADDTTAAAHQQVRPMVTSAIASGWIDAKLKALGILPEAEALRETYAQDALADQIPNAWLDRLTIVGTPEDWRAAIERLVDAGAQNIVLVPLPGRGVDEIDVLARQIQLLT